MSRQKSMVFGVNVDYLELYDPDTRQLSYAHQIPPYQMEDMAVGEGGKHSIPLGNGILLHSNGAGYATTGCFLQMPFPLPIPLISSPDDKVSWSFMRGFWGRFTLFSKGGLNTTGTATQPKAPYSPLSCIQFSINRRFSSNSRDVLLLFRFARLVATRPINT